jgi:spermidine synthase
MCGLGAGSVAAYARAGDTFRFYEIDPAVLELSEGPSPVFTYLSGAPGKIEVALGDARVSLERELKRGQLQRFDVLGVDAFSGDAIPVHLITHEALTLYFQHLADDGVLALHISNRHLDLLPVVNAIAQRMHLQHLVVDTEYDDDDELRWDSTWVLLARDRAALAAYGPGDEKRDAAARRVRPWTDEYSNVVSVLK